MYWLLYYTDGLWNPSQLETYTYTVNMHLVPVLVLAVEGLLNSIVFDIKNGFWFSLWMISAYFPLTYFSNKIVGFYPYTYIDWS